jgi:hypothetical protein
MIRLAALLVLLGLAVQLVSLLWAHPTAFLLFAIVGGGLMGLGVLVYLRELLLRGGDGG